MGYWMGAFAEHDSDTVSSFRVAALTRLCAMAIARLDPRPPGGSVDDQHRGKLLER